MFKKHYLIYTVTVFTALLMLGYGIYSEKKAHEGSVIALHKSEVTTGAQDRVYWSELLYKISYPVIHNLAEGTLKKNMPLETTEGYGMPVEKVSHLEELDHIEKLTKLLK